MRRFAPGPRGETEDIMNLEWDTLMYLALKNEPDPNKGHGLPHELMGRLNEPEHGLASVNTDMNGLVLKRVKNLHKASSTLSGLGVDDMDFQHPSDASLPDPIDLIPKKGDYQIAYTIMTSQEQPTVEQPWLVFLHGVPTNRRQWWQVQKLCAFHFPTMSFDMLGMGQSDHPRLYGESMEYISDFMKGMSLNPPSAYKEAWKWENDVGYIDQLIMELLPEGAPFVFVADDWGGGILSHFSTKSQVRDRMVGTIYLDPIALDGYPVPEIQAIGRAAAMDNDEQFSMMMGAFDQTLTQIYKTMVHNPDKRYNQYSMRDILFPYVSQDYVSPAIGIKSTSQTMHLRMHSIRVLADRAAVLSSALLLPYHPEKNPDGVPYSMIYTPTLVMWGAKDNMMPENQRYRFVYMMKNSTVTHIPIENAGHFAGTDKPYRVTETIINWMITTFGKNICKVFIGLKGIFKGDEHMMVPRVQKMLDVLYDRSR